jgi:hypothetical protein
VWLYPSTKKYRKEKNSGLARFKIRVYYSCSMCNECRITCWFFYLSNLVFFVLFCFAQIRYYLCPRDASCAFRHDRDRASLNLSFFWASCWRESFCILDYVVISFFLYLFFLATKYRLLDFCLFALTLAITARCFDWNI